MTGNDLQTIPGDLGDGSLLNTQIANLMGGVTFTVAKTSHVCITNQNSSFPYANHGAGIFTCKTGSFMG